MEDINENTQNLYIIKRRLADLKKISGEFSFFYYVGGFIVKITTLGDSIVKEDFVHVCVSETHRSSSGGPSISSYIDLESDYRFKNYKPIKYTTISNGHNMPVVNLYELIKYLHRLDKLAVFT